MKDSIFSVVWAAAIAALVYFCVGDTMIAGIAFLAALHINFFSLTMIYCGDYCEKMCDGMLTCLPVIVFGGLGGVAIIAIFLAFFVGAPLYFVIRGRKDV